MYNKKELEIVLNTKLEDLDSSIWEAVKDTGAVTIRDLVDVDHSKAHWTKKSLSEADELLSCFGLTFSRSVSDNKYIASVGAFPISLSYFDGDIYVLPNERKFVREK